MNNFPDLSYVTAYRYILINTEFEQAIPAPLWHFTETIWEWLCQEIENDELKLLKPGPRENWARSYTIANFTWEPNQDESLFASLELKIFKDSGYAQLALMEPGINSNNLLALLKRISSYKIPQISPDEFLISDDYCIYAETPTTNSLKDACTDLLKRIPPNWEKSKEMRNLFWDSDDKEFIYEYSWGCVGFTKNLIKPILVIRKANSSGIIDASSFINIILPRLLLFSKKIIQNYLIYEKDRENIKKIARELEKELKDRDPVGKNRLNKDSYEESSSVPKEKLELLEEMIRKISSKEDELIEKAGWLDKLLIAIEDNFRQLKKVLEHSVVLDSRSKLWDLFGKNNLTLLDQMKIDSKFFQAHNQEAGLTLRTLQSLVNVEQAKLQRKQEKENKKIAKIAATMGVMLAIVDGFSDVLHWFIRSIIVLAGIFRSWKIWKKDKS